ncbi:WxL domain-containing protein [Carnobacterium maltaromaticum]|uniref:WxL domain-containing protein n=1 Tax=Carnobacterium maltaromaticum TaxID=2751 RepID=UPI00165A6DB8|nr:WxL domain-containing protein [Carnobacterium maltaromaticum]MBC9810503.1 WxL domain-containing protein [Carnobacterium maltaromaticum]
MKMTKLVTSGAVLISVIALGSATVSAATAGTKATNGTVKFITDTDITNPVDPLDPEKPVTPVDPVDPEKPVDPGTAGPLSIDFASPLYFGEQKISTVDKVYTADAQPLSDSTTRPNYVQVTDKRGGEQGWTLQVKQDGQFATADDNELVGASITFANGEAIAGSASAIPSILTTGFSLVPDGTGAAQVVMAAKAGEGAGTQIYRAGDDATKASSISLSVPGKTIKYQDTYTTSLTWTLTDVPGAE